MPQSFPPQPQHTRFTAAILLALLLLGCGGGGGPTVVMDPVPSDANTTVSFNGVTISTETGSTYYTAASRRMAFGTLAHLSDVGTIEGLTGKGVWIEIIDDFTSPEDASILIPTLQRTRVDVVNGTNPTSTSTSCTMRYQWDFKYSHGDLVSSIAGGTFAQTSVVAKLSVPEANSACASSFYGTKSDAALTATVTVDPSKGVAPEATVLRSLVDLSSSQDADQTWAVIQGHLQNSLGSSGSQTIDVINMSLSKNINGAGKTLADVISAVEKYPITGTVDTVITVSAGNNSKPCNQSNLNGCNQVAVALGYVQDETKNSTIVVGALTGPANAQTMADYSTRPGFLKDRFIWASGDAGHFPAQGTSFAAPRVAGVAALLRQKFPKLTSAEIANAILDSASKDMDNDGKDDFVDPDPIFGRGKLSLPNALAKAAEINSKKP